MPLGYFEELFYISYFSFFLMLLRSFASIFIKDIGFLGVFFFALLFFVWF